MIIKFNSYIIQEKSNISNFMDLTKDEISFLYKTKGLQLNSDIKLEELKLEEFNEYYKDDILDKTFILYIKKNNVKELFIYRCYDLKYYNLTTKIIKDNRIPIDVFLKTVNHIISENTYVKLFIVKDIYVNKSKNKTIVDSILELKDLNYYKKLYLKILKELHNILKKELKNYIDILDYNDKPEIYKYIDIIKNDILILNSIILRDNFSNINNIDMIFGDGYKISLNVFIERMLKYYNITEKQFLNYKDDNIFFDKIFRFYIKLSIEGLKYYRYKKIVLDLEKNTSLYKDYFNKIKDIKHYNKQLDYLSKSNNFDLL